MLGDNGIMNELLNEQELVGNAFEELSLEEMALSQGSGDLQARSEAFTLSLGISFVVSLVFC